MEDKSEHDFEQVTYQEPSYVKKTFIPTEQFNNSLPTSIELVQLTQPTLVYIFPKTLTTYA
jgi:hypothetical protein